MGHRNPLVPAPRWLLPILTLALVLGHVCELPAYLDLVVSPHVTEADGHATHSQAHDHEMSCDPVDALASSGSIGAVAPVLAAVQVAPLGSLLPGRFVTASLEHAKGALSRPPLFLLHASLLI
jgi:hypothetical protein